MSTFERLREAIAVTLKVPAASITEKTVQTDVGAWDSIGHVSVMIAVEQTFDVVLDVEDFARLTSVRAIIDHLQEQGAT